MSIGLKIHEKVNVSLFSYNNAHIFYYYDEKLKGLFIIWLNCGNKSHPTKNELKAFKLFLDKYKNMDIYFSTENYPEYIKNHCEFHGSFGEKQVYRYARY